MQKEKNLPYNGSDVCGDNHGGWAIKIVYTNHLTHWYCTAMKDDKKNFLRKLNKEQQISSMSVWLKIGYMNENELWNAVCLSIIKKAALFDFSREAMSRHIYTWNNENMTNTANRKWLMQDCRMAIYVIQS